MGAPCPGADTLNPSRRPLPKARPAFRKARRGTSGIARSCGRSSRPIMRSRAGWNSSNLGRLFDGGADTPIGAAAANVTGHRRLDTGSAWVRIAGQQRGRRHDLARLAIAPLNDFEVEPGFLDL